MKPTDVIVRLQEIRDNAFDPEHAHGLQDDLMREVLRSIAEGSCADPAETARVALQVGDIEFPRWYA